MAVIRKNMWLIFYFLLVTGFIFLGIASYIRWSTIFTVQTQKQENMVRLLASASQSLFATQELTLDIFAGRMMEDERYKDPSKIKRQFNEILALNPALLAIGLTAPDGKYLFISSQDDTSNLPNLKEQPQSRDTFLNALYSPHMVIGRTYYFEPLKEWVIPIRKAIRDDTDTVKAVMTGALRLKDTYEPIIQKLHFRSDYIFDFIRDSDLFHQYRSEATKYENFYETPISSE